MSTIRFPRVNRSTAARVLAGAGTAGLLALGAAAPAHASPRFAPDACQIQNTIGQLSASINGARFILCDPPGGDPMPLPVTVQRSLDGVSWTTVAYDDGNTGVATYFCTGTGKRYYRLKEATYKQITAACS